MYLDQSKRSSKERLDKRNTNFNVIEYVIENRDRGETMFDQDVKLTGMISLFLLEVEN